MCANHLVIHKQHGFQKLVLKHPLQQIHSECWKILAGEVPHACSLSPPPLSLWKGGSPKLDQSPGSPRVQHQECNKIGNIYYLKDNGKKNSREVWMLGQAWSTRSLGAPDRSCQELRPCHSLPKEGEPTATNLDGGNGGKTYKVEETGMRLWERRAQGRTWPRALPDRQLGCACLRRAQHSCVFTQAKNFSLLPNKFHLHILQGSCSIETLQSALTKCLANKFKPICSCFKSECHRLTFAVQFLFLSRRKSSLEGKNCTVQTLQWIN